MAKQAPKKSAKKIIGAAAKKPSLKPPARVAPMAAKVAKPAPKGGAPVSRPAPKVSAPAAKPAPVAKSAPLAKAPAAKPAPVSKMPAAKSAPLVAKKQPSPPVSRASLSRERGRELRDARRDLQLLPPAGPQSAPVPTNGKPRKNLAGITPKELEHFRDLLLQKRREIVGDMSQMEREALRTGGGSNLSNLPLHMADMGTDNYEQEFTLGLVEKDRNLLREINTALAKIMDGSYGTCEGTGKPISKVRLEAQPWARFSIDYARQRERNFIR